jgi:hypothetical protein
MNYMVDAILWMTRAIFPCSAAVSGRQEKKCKKGMRFRVFPEDFINAGLRSSLCFFVCFHCRQYHLQQLQPLEDPAA